MSKFRLRSAARLSVAALCVAVLAACVPTADVNQGENVESELEVSVLDAVDGANGVSVSSNSSGAGNTEVVVRLYLDSDDPQAMVTAVDTAFATAWQEWPVAPVGVTVGVVVGEKPAEPGRSDPDEISLDDVATELGIPLKRVHKSIHQNAPELIERYGQRKGS